MAVAPKLYITVDDFQEVSRVKPLVERLEDEEIEDYILEAMTLIDSYIGEGYERYEVDQEFIFPRYEDTENTNLVDPWIPRPIVTATRIVVDALIKKEMTGVLAHEIQSETNHAHSYTKFQGSSPDRGFGEIPPRAVALLDPFRNSGGFFAVSQ